LNVQYRKCMHSVTILSQVTWTKKILLYIYCISYSDCQSSSDLLSSQSAQIITAPISIGSRPAKWQSVKDGYSERQAFSGFSSITHMRSKWRQACVEERGVTASLLEPADSESVHATTACTIRPTTESSHLRSASRFWERSHYFHGRSYIRSAVFIAASAAHPHRYKNVTFQDQQKHYYENVSCVIPHSRNIPCDPTYPCPVYLDLVYECIRTVRKTMVPPDNHISVNLLME
jgi:hypothetical protein